MELVLSDCELSAQPLHLWRLLTSLLPLEPLLEPVLLSEQHTGKTFPLSRLCARVYRYRRKVESAFSDGVVKDDRLVDRVC